MTADTRAAFWRTLDEILALPTARPGDYPASEWCPPTEARA